MHQLKGTVPIPWNSCCCFADRKAAEIFRLESKLPFCVLNLERLLEILEFYFCLLICSVHSGYVCVILAS